VEVFIAFHRDIHDFPLKENCCIEESDIESVIYVHTTTRRTLLLSHKKQIVFTPVPDLDKERPY
jgi:hypothetical protein